MRLAPKQQLYRFLWSLFHRGGLQGGGTASPKQQLNFTRLIGDFVITEQIDFITIGIRKRKTVNVGDVFTKRHGYWQRKVLACWEIDGFFQVEYSQNLVNDERGFEGRSLCSVECLFSWGFKTESSAQ